jgi:HTH-type transcriptional regulator, competence development regulator
LTNNGQMEITRKHSTFGELLRSLRVEAGQTLKTVSEQIGIVTSLLAKIERNERQLTNQIIKEVSKYYKVDEKELKFELLNDQIAYKIFDEEADLDIFRVAEEKV